jgi:predicted transcriptional regulator
MMLENLRSEIELLRRHVKVLRMVKQHEPVGIIKLSELSGIPQHKVRYSLRVLEQKGIIKPSPQGAVTTRKAESFLKTLPEEIKRLKKELDSCLE